MEIISNKVIFSEDAYNTILTEAFHKDPVETGGILLGQIENDTWYVIESIEPGPGSVFRSAYFEYDTAFVNYLAKARARRYAIPLRLLGLWHRHPGAYDRFSSTDDETNLLYAKLSSQGALSGLVNIDPEFRLSLYHFDEKLKYRKIVHAVSSKDIPEKFLRKKYENYFLQGPKPENHGIE
jgi:proteasome lid subunit RPN8/RPN11